MKRWLAILLVGALALTVLGTVAPAGAALPSRVAHYDTWNASGAFGVAVGPDGSVYVARQGAAIVSKYDPTGAHLRSVSTGFGGDPLPNPAGVAVDVIDDTTVVYVASYNGWVEKFDEDLNPLLRFGQGDLTTPIGLAIDARNHWVYVADEGSDRIVRYTPAGKNKGSFGTSGSNPGELDHPRGIAFDPWNLLYVSDSDRIQKFKPDGTWKATWSGPMFGFNNPHHVATDDAGWIYVANTGAAEVVRLKRRGAVRTRWSHGMSNQLYGVGVDGNGNVYTADSSLGRVMRFGDHVVADRCDERPPTILGTLGDDDVTGTANRDIISLLAGDDKATGDVGLDRFCAGDGNDDLRGGPGADRMFGEAGDDYMIGGSGDDYMIGGTGYDTLFGQLGNDTCEGDDEDSCELNP